ncbi:sensor histidine kinase [Actomonas aquatica]|uniref:histidine kinase n=1 Tax=Actomonas aquatica TaxID=2866162 RepID=A0ABZ1C5L5_9BACT|nr:ATP-binding protein [Opitutus sp. WL0086]WRQ86643.1 ATP-binding protein [Opitutus sp. WL0086]
MVAWNDLISRSEVVALLTGATLPAAGFALAGWGLRRSRAQVYFAGYMLGLLLVFWLQGVLNGPGADQGVAPPWWGWLSDLIQLPYAWLYVRFVRTYFELESWSSRWAAWCRWLGRLYVIPLVLVGLKALTGLGLSSWVIMLFNLANVLGSYALTGWAWHRRREGAGWFLVAVSPLALSGLLLAVQWAVNAGGSEINGLFPFWLGVLVHLALGVVALGVQHRRLDLRVQAEAAARDEAERKAVKLAAVNETQEEYASFISHEVRTPLHAVLGISRRLHESGLTPDQREQVATIQSTARLMLGVVDSMLDIAKVEAAAGTLKREAVDVRALLNETVAMFAPQLEWKRLRVETTVQPELPAFVSADSLRLQQVLINLVAYAVNQTQEGAVDIRVQWERDEQLTLAVTDAGGGISARHQANLFTAPQRVSLGLAEGGLRAPTGLGLIIARRLADLMRASLTVDSEPGRGTTLTLALKAPRWSASQQRSVRTFGVRERAG